MPLSVATYEPLAAPLGRDPIQAQYIQTELRRIADAMRELAVTDSFGSILQTERLLGEGKLYSIDFSPIDGAALPWTIDLHTNVDWPVFLDLSVVSYDTTGADNLLLRTFIGGDVTGGTPVITRPLNSDAPDSRVPINDANEGSTVNVAGTPVSVRAGNSFQSAVAIVPPDAEYYATFSQLGSGKAPTDIQLTLKFAVVDPYPKTEWQT